MKNKHPSTFPLKSFLALCLPTKYIKSNTYFSKLKITFIMITERHKSSLKILQLLYSFMYPFPLTWNSDFSAYVLRTPYPKRAKICTLTSWIFIVLALCCAVYNIMQYIVIDRYPKYNKLLGMIHFGIILLAVGLGASAIAMLKNTNSTLIGFAGILKLEREILGSIGKLINHETSNIVYEHISQILLSKILKQKPST